MMTDIINGGGGGGGALASISPGEADYIKPIFPRGREVPPGWEPGQHGSHPITRISAEYEMAAHRPSKSKKHTWKKIRSPRKSRRPVLARPVRLSTSDISLASATEKREKKQQLQQQQQQQRRQGRESRRHRAAAVDRSSSDEMQTRSEFDRKRRYYEKQQRQQQRSRSHHSGQSNKESHHAREKRHGSRPKKVTAQVSFLKTIDDICNAVEDEQEDYVEDFDDSLSLDRERETEAKCAYSLAQYYSKHIEVSSRGGEALPSVQGVRIVRANHQVPSTISLERLKVIRPSTPQGVFERGVGLDGRGHHSHPNLPTSSAKWPDASSDISVTKRSLRKLTNNIGVPNQIGVGSDYRHAWEQLRANFVERNAQYSQASNLSHAGEVRHSVAVKKSSTEDGKRGSNKSEKNASQKKSQVTAKASTAKEKSSNYKLTQITRLPPPPNRSEEDTWCYSVNAMLLKAKQAVEDGGQKGTHRFPRHNSAAVVSPVVEHKATANFLKTLLKQDAEDIRLNKVQETNTTKDTGLKRQRDRIRNAVNKATSHTRKSLIPGTTTNNSCKVATGGECTSPLIGRSIRESSFLPSHSSHGHTVETSSSACRIQRPLDLTNPHNRESLLLKRSAAQQTTSAASRKEATSGQHYVFEKTLQYFDYPYMTDHSIVPLFGNSNTNAATGNDSVIPSLKDTDMYKIDTFSPEDVSLDLNQNSILRCNLDNTGYTHNKVKPPGPISQHTSRNATVTNVEQFNQTLLMESLQTLEQRSKYKGTTGYKNHGMSAELAQAQIKAQAAYKSFLTQSRRNIEPSITNAYHATSVVNLSVNASASKNKGSEKKPPAPMSITRMKGNTPSVASPNRTDRKGTTSTLCRRQDADLIQMCQQANGPITISVKSNRAQMPARKYPRRPYERPKRYPPKVKLNVPLAVFGSGTRVEKVVGKMSQPISADMHYPVIGSDMREGEANRFNSSDIYPAGNLRKAESCKVHQTRWFNDDGRLLSPIVPHSECRNGEIYNAERTDQGFSLPKYNTPQQDDQSNGACEECDPVEDFDAFEKQSNVANAHECNQHNEHHSNRGTDDSSIKSSGKVSRPNNGNNARDCDSAGRNNNSHPTRLEHTKAQGNRDLNDPTRNTDSNKINATNAQSRVQQQCLSNSQIYGNLHDPDYMHISDYHLHNEDHGSCSKPPSSGHRGFSRHIKERPMRKLSARSSAYSTATSESSVSLPAAVLSGSSLHEEYVSQCSATPDEQARVESSGSFRTLKKSGKGPCKEPAPLVSYKRDSHDESRTNRRTSPDVQEVTCKQSDPLCAGYCGDSPNIAPRQDKPEYNASPGGDSGPGGEKLDVVPPLDLDACVYGTPLATERDDHGSPVGLGRGDYDIPLAPEREEHGIFSGTEKYEYVFPEASEPDNYVAPLASERHDDTTHLTLEGGNYVTPLPSERTDYLPPLPSARGNDVITASQGYTASSHQVDASRALSDRSGHIDPPPPTPRTVSLDYLRSMRLSDLAQTFIRRRDKLLEALEAVTTSSFYVAAVMLREWHLSQADTLVIKVHYCSSRMDGTARRCRSLAEPALTVFYTQNHSCEPASMYTVDWLQRGIYSLLNMDIVSDLDHVGIPKLGCLLGHEVRGGSTAPAKDQYPLIVLGAPSSSRGDALRHVSAARDRAHHSGKVAVLVENLLGIAPQWTMSPRFPLVRGRSINTTEASLKACVVTKRCSMDGSRVINENPTPKEVAEIRQDLLREMLASLDETSVGNVVAGFQALASHLSASDVGGAPVTYSPMPASGGQAIFIPASQDELGNERLVTGSKPLHARHQKPRHLTPSNWQVSETGLAIHKPTAPFYQHNQEYQQRQCYSHNHQRLTSRVPRQQKRETDTASEKKRMTPLAKKSWWWKQPAILPSPGDSKRLGLPPVGTNQREMSQASTKPGCDPEVARNAVPHVVELTADSTSEGKLSGWEWPNTVLPPPFPDKLRRRRARSRNGVPKWKPRLKTRGAPRLGPKGRARSQRGGGRRKGTSGNDDLRSVSSGPDTSSSSEEDEAHTARGKTQKWRDRPKSLAEIFTRVLNTNSVPFDIRKRMEDSQLDEERDALANLDKRTAGVDASSLRRSTGGGDSGLLSQKSNLSRMTTPTPPCLEDVRRAPLEQEYDMLNDAQETRDLWKRCFPPVRFSQKKQRWRKVKASPNNPLLARAEVMADKGADRAMLANAMVQGLGSLV